MTNKKRKVRIRKQEAARIPAGALSEGLVKHSKLRNTQMKQFAEFAPLSTAFDEVLAQLRLLSEVEDLDAEVVHLLKEACEWVIEGVYKIISSSPPHDIEEARKLIELEFLLRDFTFIPENLKEWAELDTWERHSKFGFGELRKREEARQGLDETTVVAARDYWVTHSVNSHPKPLKNKKTSEDPGGWTLLTSMGDLLEHAKTIVIVAEGYISSQDLTISAHYKKLSTKAIDESWERMNTALHSHIPPDKLEMLRQPRPKKDKLHL